MEKSHSPKALATLMDRLIPALRRLEGSGETRATRISLLTYLAENGPCPMRNIAEHLQISPQAVTGLIDSLEAEGLLVRERHPTDRRKTLIRLNDHAKDHVKTARMNRADELTSLFKGLPKEDRAAFARVAEALLERLR